MGEVCKAPEKCESLKDLFYSWKKHYEEEYKSYKNLFKGSEYEGLEKCFFPDGYLSEKEECKILFVSRESRVPNDEVLINNSINTKNKNNYTEFYMRNVVNDIKKKGNGGGICYPRHMAAVRDYLGNNKGKDWYGYEKENDCFKILFDCGYMNLNKHGGRAKTGDKFTEIVKKDQEYIKQQINIMQPKTIVLLGKGLRSIFDDLNLKLDKKTTILETYHPKASIGYDNYMNPLKNNKSH